MIKFVYIVIIIVLFAQYVFQQYTTELSLTEPVVPIPYSSTQAEVLSCGEQQMLFRIFALQLQYMGDPYGITTSLAQYDYKLLLQWLYLLDSLDQKSHFTPAIAAYYYSQTPDVHSLQYIVDYLVFNANHHIEERWWWVIQAALIAKRKLKNNVLAVEISKQLIDIKNDMPLWARQMSAIILADIGEMQSAYAITNHILQNIDSLSDKDKNYIHYFLTERLKIITEHTK